MDIEAQEPKVFDDLPNGITDWEYYYSNELSFTPIQPVKENVVTLRIITSLIIKDKLTSDELCRCEVENVLSFTNELELQQRNEVAYRLITACAASFNDFLKKHQSKLANSANFEIGSGDELLPQIDLAFMMANQAN